jgi:AcrR family transcriptional regulator
MDALLKKLNIQFNDAKKPQSLQTLNDLIEAAEKIVEEGHVDNFAARSLSKVSGYSLGSLVQRLGKIENIFLYAITKERGKHITTIGEALIKIDPHETVASVVNQFVDFAMEALHKVSPRIMRYYEKRASLRVENITDVFLYSEEVIPYLKQIIDQNKSNTFRKIPDDEMPYVARAMFLFLERPFAEGDPIAGTPEHRAMAVNALTKILET